MQPIPDWFLVVVTIGVFIMAVAMLVQLGLMFGMYQAFRRIEGQFEGITRQIQPMLNTARSIVDDARKQADRLAGTIEQVTETARAQLIKVDQLVTEASDRARLQLIRLDEVMADTAARFQETTEYLQRSVVRPVREMQAVVHGLRSGVEYLVKRRRRTPTSITQDEELFI